MRLLSVIALGVLVTSLPNAIVHAEPAKEPRTVVFGDLQLTYDPALWSVAERDGHLAIECSDRDCRNISVYASMEDDPRGDGCTADAAVAGLGHMTFADEYLYEDTEGWSARHDGLTFHFATYYLGCRNLAGGPVLACTHHNGTTYLFEAPGKHCHTPWGIEAAVTELLLGVKPR